MRVLFVGDNQQIADAMREALGAREVPAELHVVPSCPAAVAWLASSESTQCVVIEDKTMLDEHGEPSTTQARLLKLAPTLVATAEPRFDDVLRWLRLGAGGCLAYPAERSVILGALYLVSSGEYYLPRDVVARLLSDPAAPAADRRGTAANGDDSDELARLGISRRQYEILTLLSRGFSIKHICQHLLISEGTAKTHISALYRRLGARNRGEAIYIAAQRGARQLFEDRSH
ncbi:response regulator transcription factor [Pandoraea sp.]|uniref:response regulator transcription factor n=1 Tax=Pandoraea sp. TaxID=1883445 RepID=UPI0012253FAF|nr:response regulator transcription factor [Pandoraea sp.]TAL52882.1 MAG: response regulator transcription factor [Pandoraea sp.]TAM19673.1 MAG: response regulator transcription factor [Pandoraea sp.]